MSVGRWLAVVAFALLPTLSLAQGTQQAVPAPAFHAATKVTFPDQIAGATRARSVDYGKTYNEPGLGQSWHYTVPHTLSAGVYLYTFGQTTIASGPNSPAVLQQFEQAMGDIPQSGKYEQIMTVKGPVDCMAGGLTFRCVIQNCLVVSTRSADKLELLMTGFRNHFLKIRLDWHQNSPQGDAAVDRFLQALGSQVLR